MDRRSKIFFSKIVLILMLLCKMFIWDHEIRVLKKRVTNLEQEEPKTISILATHKDGKYKVVDVWEEVD